MKKFILTSILSLSTVFVLSAQVIPSACVDIQNELSYANRASQLEDQILKSEVITLQNFLATTKSPVTKRPYISQAAYLRVTPGDFDGITAAAVRYFQFEKRLVKSRTIKSSAVILGNATRAKIAEVSGCTIATSPVPTPASKVVEPKMAKLTLAPGVTAVVTDNPTLALEYDSSNSEAALVARATVAVTAGYSDLYLYNVNAANALVFINSNGINPGMSNTEASGTLIDGNATLVTGVNGLSFYKIPANETVTFAFVAKRNPKLMFAGAYTASVQQMDAYTSTNALQEEYVSVPVAPNVSRQVTIVGEVSPYISSATVDATGLVRVTGSRFDLPGNLYMIDGTTSITNSKGDANTISFNINDYNLSAGYHTLQILNPRVGNSNDVSFEVTSSFTGTASAYVMSSPAPTLTLKYNSQNKEASLVYEAYVNVTATGGDIKINSGNDYSKDGYTFNIVTTNAGNQQAVASSSPVAQFAAGLTKGNGLIVPSGNRATYKVTQVYNVKQSFAGSYKAAIQLYDPTYTRNLLGGNTSNAITIIGETSPYITTAVIDGNNNVVLTGVRFHPTGNTIISGDQRLNLPSTEGGTKIIFPLRSLGITNTSGYLNIQVSHPTEGLSNSTYIQFDQNYVASPITNPATEVTPTGAVLNMFFNTLGNAYTTYFNWGTNANSLTNYVRATNTLSISYLTPTNSGNNYAAPILGLSPNTNYYFVASVMNTFTGETQSGNVLSFMTPNGTQAPAPTLTFTGNNSAGTMAITSGQPVYLKWSSTNALLCNATGSWSGMKATSSTEVVYPQQTTTYTLSCGGVGGETNQVTKSVTVTICPNGQTWNGTVCAGATIPVGTTPTASAYFVSTPTLTLLKDAAGNPTSLKAEYVVNVYAPTSNVTVTGFPVTPGLYGFTGTIKNTATQQIISNSGTTTVTWGAGVTTGPTNTNTITVPVGNRATFVVTQYFNTYNLPSGSYVGNITLKSYEGNNIAPNTPTNTVSMGAITPVPATVSFSASNGAVSVSSPSALEVTPTQRVTLTWSSTGMSSCTPSGTDANNPTNAGNWTGTQLNVSGTKTFASPWFTAVVANPAPVTYTISCTPVLGGTSITKSIEVKKAATTPTTPPVAGINKAIDITFKNVTPTSMDIVATFSSTIPGSQVFIIHGTDSELSAVKCTTSCGSDPARIICPSGCGIPNPLPVVADGTNRPYTFTMTGLTPNTKYTYKAYIRDPQGNLVEGTWSLQGVITPTGVVANCTTGDIASLDSTGNVVPISGGGITQADVDYVRSKSNSNDARADLDKSGTVTVSDYIKITNLLGTCPAVSTTSSGARIISSGVTFVANSSPVAQYVLGDSSLAIAKFNIKTSNAIAGAIIKDLIFTVPANTISSITVNGKVASVVGTTAALYDLGVAVPAGSTGLDLDVYVRLVCANQTGGCSGVSSSVVSLALTSLSYHDGQTSQPAITTNAKTPNHILVVSKPTLTLNQSSSGTFGNGVAKIGEFTVAADASGNIELKQIPIYLAVSGGLSITPGTVELRDKDGNSRITGTNALSGSGNFTFSLPRIISRGTSETYTVYASITGVSGAAGTQMTTFSLGSKTLFIWNDPFGGAQNLNGALLFSYPNQSQTSTAVAAPVVVEKPIAMCDYSAAQTGCTWVAGPNYNASNQCGKVLQCVEAVPVRKLNAAQFISQNVPDTMIAGQTYSVSVTMKNTGNTTWTQATYKLGSQNPQDNTVWGGRIYLATGESIAPGAQKTFTFNVKAPANVSSSNFQWRMVEEGVQWFGDSTSNISVTITQPAPTQQLVSYTPTSSSGPAISVLSPRGGETYKVGSTITMKWKFENVNEGNNSTALQIHDNSAPYKSIYTGYASNPTVNGDISVEGTQTFTIPSGTTPGSYALYITNADGWSETGYFNIVP